MHNLNNMGARQSMNNKPVSSISDGTGDGIKFAIDLTAECNCDDGMPHWEWDEEREEDICTGCGKIAV